MKVLVAEDSATMRKVLVASLKRWGYDVVESEHGAAAWDQFQRDQFPLVLTDWIMPEMSGLELIDRIRSSDLPGYVYIILLTAKSEKEDLVTAMDAGADDFLAKPVDQDELRVRLREGERIIHLERKLAEQNRQLRETQAALVQSEKLASLGQLAAGMAHEINNPIAYVSNNLAVLKRDVRDLMEVLNGYRGGYEDLAHANPALAAKLKQLEEACDLDYIREELPRLLQTSLGGLGRVRDIVLNLRDFARLDEAELDERDLNAAWESTIEVLRHEIQEKQLTVVQDFQPLPLVLCRPKKINQVLYGLLLNAIQASRSGGTIRVKTSTESEGVQMEIQDEGHGIDEAHLPRIFEPFFTTQPVGRGTGLGLAIAYQVVRDHGGTIEVDSEPGRGSTFRIYLPRQPQSRK